MSFNQKFFHSLDSFDGRGDQHNTVWYWDGDASFGVWRPTSPLSNPLGEDETLEALRLRLEREGSVARLGAVEQPPAGRPSDEEFLRVTR